MNEAAGRLHIGHIRLTGNPTKVVDVAVIGAGAGGMTAALVAAKLGLDVALIEKSALVGGTTAFSAGTAWVPATRQSKSAGFADSREAAMAYLAAEDPGGHDRSRQRAFIDQGSEAIDFLDQHTDVHFVAATHHPDYHPWHDGATTGGRALVVPEFDGRRLGDDFRLLRPPPAEFTILGGMMVAKDDIAALIKPLSSWRNFRHASSLLSRYAVDRLSYLRGTRLVMGNALAARLLLSLRGSGIALSTSTTVNALICEPGGRISGITITTTDGIQSMLRTRRGVVLATGGFGGSRAWRERLLSAETTAYSVSSSESSGDGLTLATAVGAAINRDHTSPAFWMPTSIMEGKRTTLFPHIYLDRAKPGLIAVNAAGRRFVNEGASYHDFVIAMLASNKTVATIPAWLIVDKPFLKRYGLGLVRPGARRIERFVREGYLRRAASIESLADDIGVSRDGLRESVAANNHFAKTGCDLDFGKGSNALNRHNGDPRHSPNPCLGPIAQPPFYAVAVYPADLATSVGLATDASARVLNEENAPIPGLYACGNDMASVMRGHYPGPGVTLGPAITFGYIAARHLASD